MVRFPSQPCDAPARDHAIESLAPGGADAVDHLVFVEDAVDLELLLEEVYHEVDLRLHGAAVDLNLLDVRLFLAQFRLRDLGVHDGPNNLAVSLGALDFRGHGSLGTLGSLGPALLVLREGLLLALVPVLVETAIAFVAEVASKDRGEGTKPAGRLDVADEANDAHRWRLEDAHCLDDFLLVQFRPRLVNVADDVAHSSFEAAEGGEVRRFGGVVLGKAFDLPGVVPGSLPGKKSQIPSAVSQIFGETSERMWQKGQADKRKQVS